MRNYFNYFTEVEEYFARKRGKHLLVSPLDWCLIELWRDNGIPLQVVLRGIDHSFETAERTQRRPPRSLFYCHAAVLQAFDSYRQSRLGAAAESEAAESGPFSRSAVQNHLGALAKALEAHRGELFDRIRQQLADLQAEVAGAQTFDCQEIDQDLGRLGTLVGEALRRRMDPETLERIRDEVREETRAYRRRLSKAMYEGLQKRYLDRKTQQLHRLPEFSLLSLDS